MRRLVRAKSAPNSLFLSLFAAFLLGVTALFAACSAAEAPPTGSTSTTSGTGGSTSTGSGGKGGEGGDIIDPNQKLEIKPSNPLLVIDLPPTKTVPFSCIDISSGEPVSATWKINTNTLGEISDTGVFSPNGKGIGEVLVECEHGGSSAATTLKVLIHVTEGDETLTPSELDTLKGPSGQSDPAWSFLYPYDGTVFPRGILPPEIHLNSGNAPGDAYHVQIVVNGFEYEGFFKTNATQTRLLMSQMAWDALGLVAGGQTVVVQVSKLVGGQKYGPITRKWILAKGKLHGSIYYESYDTQLTPSPGAILRIKGESPQPEVLIDNCTVCHAAAADGSTLATAQGTFDLSGGMLNPPNLWAGDASFGALYPKQGAVMVTFYAGNPQLVTKNGTIVSESGIEGFKVRAPTFSLDGKHLAFWDQAVSGTGGVLAMVDYDEAAQKFSNYDVLAAVVSQPISTWPAFTPDGKWVVFQIGTTEMTGGGTGRLVAVHTESKQLVDLLKLNGDGYMPAGPRDELKNYEPTIAPIASGGYFWITFTSRRTYGNALIGPPEVTKRLWIAALDLNPAPGSDPSHPAFYVSGQELNAGNSRGFWSLDACKATGEACETGDECCEGACIELEPGSGKTVCGTPQGCSNEFDTCETDGDCCENKGLVCIGGKCSLETPN
ncbi:MAG: PD40 domain-containing protein [Polyangiaceae bacterium]|nr:PD40 domain-containing protein [Polyangiaceae bacterium]